MKIVSLTAENFKRLKAIMIKPDGSTVIVGGKNGAGKTSALDAIKAALGGRRNCPEEPVRRGTSKAEIVLETDDFTVVRNFTAKGATNLTVTAAGGGIFTSPQAMLDSLVGSLSFDPLEFSRMKPLDQAEVVRQLVGLDFTKHDQTRAGLYDDRTLAGRELKNATAVLKTMKPVAAPGKEVSVTAELKELERRRVVNQNNDEVRDELQSLRGVDQDLARQITEFEQDVLQLKKDRKKNLIRGKRLAAKADGMQDEDLAEIEEKIAGAEKANEKCRAAAVRTAAADAVEICTRAHDALSDKLTALDLKKATAIQKAKYPIKNLRITDDGVELNKLPFEQASSAEQLRCSVAMGLALNPDMKILLVKDGSLLDENSLRLVAEMADEAGGQIWLEKVSTDHGECTVIIENGEIASE